jgi:integrase
MVAKKIDPKDVRDQEKAEALATSRRSDKSFWELVPDAMKNPMVCGLKGIKQRAEWEGSLAPHLTGGITSKAPQDISRDDVATAILAIRARGSLSQANRVTRRFFLMFEWCAGKGYIAEDAVNPATFAGRHAAALPKVVTRKIGHTSIPYRDIRTVAASLRAREPRMTALCVEWILLSAVRLENGVVASWTEIDREARVWTIPAAKMKKAGHGDHKVPLTARMLEILDELAALGSGLGHNRGSLLLFPNADGEAFNRQTMRFTLREVYGKKIEREDGSVRKASIHGLRATFRTWGENQLSDDGKSHRYDEKTLELCLAHVVGDDARNAYVRENNVEVRRAIMDDWNDYVCGLNVIPFVKRA